MSAVRPLLIPIVTARPLVRPTYHTTRDNAYDTDLWVRENLAALRAYWDEMARRCGPADESDFDGFCGGQHDIECVRWDKAQPHGDVIYGADDEPQSREPPYGRTADDMYADDAGKPATGPL